MAERRSLDETLRQMMDANLSYYRGLGKLTLDYWGAVLGTVKSIRLPVEVGPPGRSQRSSAGTETRAAGVAATSHPHVSARTSAPEPGAPAAVPPPPPPSSPAMVLEAAAGDRALGVFLVENRLQSRVSAPIMASAFTDPEGREFRPGLVFEPEVVTLDPGEQLLVRVAALLDGSLSPEVDYRGELTIPGLSGSRVKLVLRQRPASPEPASPEPAPPPRRRRTSGDRPPGPKAPRRPRARP